MPKTVAENMKTAALDFPLLFEVYQAGIRRGTEEATSFDWGCRAAGKQEDELVEALYYHLNADTKWGEPGYLDWKAVEELVAAAQGIEAATAAETVKLGSVHESPVGNADAPKSEGSCSHAQ